MPAKKSPTILTYLIKSRKSLKVRASRSLQSKFEEVKETSERKAKEKEVSYPFVEIFISEKVISKHIEKSSTEEK